MEPLGNGKVALIKLRVERFFFLHACVKLYTWEQPKQALGSLHKIISNRTAPDL